MFGLVVILLAIACGASVRPRLSQTPGPALRAQARIRGFLLGR
jgi:hypothetical protein